MSKREITLEQARRMRKRKGFDETKLQRLRFSKGMSQRELSVISGVAARSIRSYEQRERDIDSARLSTLCAMCIALGCKMSDIIEDEALIERYQIIK